LIQDVKKLYLIVFNILLNNLKLKVTFVLFHILVGA
jgi:hypothetical protein